MNSTLELPKYEITFPKHCTCHVLSSNQKDNLVELYTELYSIPRSALEMSDIYKKYSSVVVNGRQLGSTRNQTISSSNVMVKWDSGLFGDSYGTVSCRAARIEFICKHMITVNEVSITSTLVSLSWFKMHPKNEDHGKPTTVWYHDLFELDNIYSLIPVQFILARCTTLVDKLDGESVLFTCPLIDF